MDGALDLAAVGGIAVAGLEVGGAVDGGNAAVGILLHAGALDDVSAHQTHLTANGQALELGRRHLGKVLILDPQLFGKGHLAGGGIVGFAVGVVGYIKVLGLVLRVVVYDQLYGVQHCNAALSGQVQLAADAGFQLAHVDQVVGLGDAGLPHEGEDGGGGVATAAQAAQGGHTGVVPAVHNAHFHQLTQVALAHDGVGHVQACKLTLLGALAVMLGVLDAVDGRVTHVHVGAGQIDLGTQGLFALLELTGTHPAEQVKILFRGAVAPRRGTGRLAGIGTAVLAHFVAGQVVHVGLALHDELFGILVALVKVVAAVEDAAVGVGTQPVQILDDAVHVLLTLAGRVGVVQTQVELTAVLVCNGPVDVDGLGTADVQVAVGLGREAGMDLADLALGQISVDDVGQKVFICHVFSPCQRHKVPIYSIILYNTLFCRFLQEKTLSVSHTLASSPERGSLTPPVTFGASPLRDGALGSTVKLFLFAKGSLPEGAGKAVRL